MAYASLLDRLGLHRRELRAWAYYDVANSAWMTTMLQAFSPAFFVPFAASQLPADAARSRFAFGTSAMVIAVGLLGPWLGALADYKGRKKAFLGAFLGAGAALTAALYLVREGQWLLALALYGLANVAVTSTLAFYNALLPGIARPDEVDRVSTAGFALGYLGGGLLFALNIWMMASPRTFGLASTVAAFQASCVMVAAWWVLFSIPLFRHVPEPVPRLDPDEPVGESASRIALRRLAETFRELRRHRDAALLLLAFLVYNDGVNTIIRMGTTFADEIGLPKGPTYAAVLMIQFVGIPFAFAFGMLADRVGAKRAIMLALAVYTVLTVLAYGLSTIGQFFAFAFTVAMVMGGVQALSRSLFASLIPQHKAGEMFGFFGIFDRFGGAIGSMIFGVVLALTGSSRPAVVSLVVLFLLGGYLLSRVDVARGRTLARETEARARKASPAPS
ncbi:MAG: MFS transporter [Betaproteobacteria bacterium]